MSLAGRHHSQALNWRASSSPRATKEWGMVWADFPIWVAMLLAMTAALMSSDTQAKQDVSNFFVEALKPQTADLGSDPGFLLGEATETIWLRQSEAD